LRVVFCHFFRRVSSSVIEGDLLTDWIAGRAVVQTQISEFLDDAR
jgi:hypothetical protein